MAHVKIINNVVYGGPAMSIPAHLSYGQYMIEKLKENAEDETRVALINGETGHQVTFKQILQQVVNVANGLKKFGIKRGDVVALCCENRDEFVPAAIAAICCGGTITTANPLYDKDEMTHILNISRPTLMFASEMALKSHIKVFNSTPYIKNIIQFNGQPVEKGIIQFDALMLQDNSDVFEAAEVQGWSDIVFILYSSGTTGLPKGVTLTHLNALYSAACFEHSAAEKGKREAIRRHLTFVPWYHAYGLMSTLNYLAVDKLLVYFAGFHPEKYLNAIQEYKVNLLQVVPPIVVFLAKSPLVEKYDMSSVKEIWCGAAPLTLETIEQTMKRFPNCDGVFQAYGMTETSLAATHDLNEEGVKRKPGSGGVPLNGVKVKVVDVETRKKLGPNENGEICIKGPIIMKGYAGDEAATRDMMDDKGYLKTGDIGYYDQDGYFFVVDRLKELIKYKGHQVPPALVESVLLQHSGVAECGVVGAPDERAGELPTAFVVLKPGAQLSEQDLINFTNTKLSPEKRLHGGVIFVKEIPKNPSGKILRRVLKQLLRKARHSKL